MRFSQISLGALALAMATPAMADTMPIGAPLTSGTSLVVASPDPTGVPVATVDDPAPAAPVPVLAAPKPDDTATAAPKAFTITGAVTVVSDYRFRGLTQSDEKPVPQATININHSSGFYIGTWASAIDGGPDGSTPLLIDYGIAEVDLYAGFTKTFGGFGVDVGLLYYLYPGGGNNYNTDFFEPYASINYTIGPVNAKVGAAYAWGGQKGLDFTAGKDDNIYVYGELSGSIPKTPITLKAHLGYSEGPLAIVDIVGGNNYLDWSLTAEATFAKHFKIGVSYVDTDISEAKGVWFKGSGSTFKSKNSSYAQFYGRGATGLVYISAFF